MVCIAVIEQLEIVLIELEYAEADLEAKRQVGPRGGAGDLGVHVTRLRAANQAIHLAISVLSDAMGSQRNQAPASV